MSTLQPIHTYLRLVSDQQTAALHGLDEIILRVHDAEDGELRQQALALQRTLREYEYAAKAAHELAYLAAGALPASVIVGRPLLELLDRLNDLTSLHCKTLANIGDAAARLQPANHDLIDDARTLHQDLRRMADGITARIEANRSEVQPFVRQMCEQNAGEPAANCPMAEALIPNPDQSPAAPKALLLSWREILNALKQPNDETKRRAVAHLNKNTNGPILFNGRGAQPTADKDKLLKWWNQYVEKRYGELKQKREDASATVRSEYRQGSASREETVLPDIAGHVKKRRKRL